LKQFPGMSAGIAFVIVGRHISKEVECDRVKGLLNFAGVLNV
jgi:hypothetical protein